MPLKVTPSSTHRRISQREWQTELTQCCEPPHDLRNYSLLNGSWMWCLPAVSLHQRLRARVAINESLSSSLNNTKRRARCHAQPLPMWLRRDAHRSQTPARWVRAKQASRRCLPSPGHEETPIAPKHRTQGEGQTGVPSGGEGCLVVAPCRVSLLILAADALCRVVPRLTVLVPL